MGHLALFTVTGSVSQKRILVRAILEILYLFFLPKRMSGSDCPYPAMVISASAAGCLIFVLNLVILKSCFNYVIQLSIVF